MKKQFKKIFFFLVVILTLGLTSCEKHDNNFHRVRFHLTFKEVPPVGASDFIEVNCSPNYDNDPPVIYKDYITPGYEWDYEFWQLKNGDEVQFIVNPQLHYWFVMEVYVDDVLVSTREVVTSSQTYYATETIFQSGLNNDEETNFPVISFYYNE
jgi:hypothetical protein